MTLTPADHARSRLEDAARAYARALRRASADVRDTTRTSHLADMHHALRAAALAFDAAERQGERN